LPFAESVIRRKIRVLFVNRNYHIGGAEVVVANLCRKIDKERFDVSLIHLINERGYIGDELYGERFDVQGVKPSDIPVLKYFDFLKLRRIIIEKKIDLLHSHCLNGLIDSALCRMTLLHVRHLHTFHFGNYPHINKKYLALERLFCKVPDKLVAVGNVQREVILETFGIPPEQILTVWNGVIRERGDVAPEFMEMYGNRKGVIIGVIASLITQKGLSCMLDVALELKRRGIQALFLVVGDGHLRGELETKALTLGLSDTVYFLGWVRNAATRILPLFDILFQPSLWEAMSMVILEAMAAGKPIVATCVGENSYMIDHGRNGFLVTPGDINGMTDCLETLARNPDLLKRQGLQGEEMFREKFTSDAMVRKYEDLYENICRNLPSFPGSAEGSRLLSGQAADTSQRH
jgi:glycosyltransferase involved in cell wall biosynthesis